MRILFVFVLWFLPCECSSRTWFLVKVITGYWTFPFTSTWVISHTQPIMESLISLQSIEQRHFQWPWTTPNLDFKVTLFLDTEYLIKGYYGRRIVPLWMTFNDLFKVTIIQRQITWKWYNIKVYLQWPTNRKSYMIYQTAPFSMTLNDPYPLFQDYAILSRWISEKYDIQA